MGLVTRGLSRVFWQLSWLLRPFAVLLIFAYWQLGHLIFLPSRPRMMNPVWLQLLHLGTLVPEQSSSALALCGFWPVRHLMYCL